MDTVFSDSLVTWRLRRDLEFHSGDAEDRSWVIRDPVRLTYFRVEAEELAFLQNVNGRNSGQQIRENLARAFPDTEFASGNLAHFLASGISSGLLVPTGIGFGRVLAERARSHRDSSVIRQSFSIFTRRFRGIDPSGVLSFLNNSIGWIYRPPVVSLVIAFVLTAALLVVSRLDQLLFELPSLARLMSPANLVAMGLAVVVVKVIHELGHGLTCVHHGGECHEIGCLLIGFLPMLYCDVSDSWLQKNPLKRVQVAAAGIAVEIFIAAACGVLWVFSVPGFLHSLFLNIMLLCSVNTILVNGNPLLRYDGYYVLSDLIGIPNLGPESRSAATSVFDRVVLGVPSMSIDGASVLRRFWMPVFGVASLTYRMVALFAILLMIHQALKAWRLESVSGVVILLTVSGLLFSLAVFVKQRYQSVTTSGRASRRAFAGVFCLFAALTALLFWPLPYSISAPFTLTPGEAKPIFVESGGYITAHISPGDPVKPSQELITLVNPDLELEVARLEGEVAIASSRVQQLEGRRRDSLVSSNALPAARKAVQNAVSRLQMTQARADRLVINSSEEGFVFPVRHRQTKDTGTLQQEFWQGTPLDSANTSTWIDEQTLVCWLGDFDDLRAVVYVPQNSIEFAGADATVQLTFDASPGERLTGRVVKVGRTAESTFPPELASKGLQADDAAISSMESRFRVYVQLDSAALHICPPLYSSGYAAIESAPRSLARRAWRLLQRTFAFEI